MDKKQSNFCWKRIDSDKIRRDCMDLKDNVDLDDLATNKQLFIETKQQALQKITEELVK